MRLPQGAFHADPALWEIEDLLSGGWTRPKFTANEGVEFFGLLFLRHHAAAVEDFKSCARIEAEEFCRLFDRIGLILLAPDERDVLPQARETLARVRVQIAGEKGCDGVLRSRLMTRRVVLRDETVGRAPPVVEEFFAGVVAYAALAGDDVIEGCAQHR